MTGRRSQERRARRAAELRLFLQQYARTARRQGDPNDRRYSRHTERWIARLDAEAFDRLARAED